MSPAPPRNRRKDPKSFDRPRALLIETVPVHRTSACLPSAVLAHRRSPYAAQQRTIAQSSPRFPFDQSVLHSETFSLRFSFKVGPLEYGFNIATQVIDC